MIGCAVVRSKARNAELIRSLHPKPAGDERDRRLARLAREDKGEGVAAGLGP